MEKAAPLPILASKTAAMSFIVEHSACILIRLWRRLTDEMERGERGERREVEERSKITVKCKGTIPYDRYSRWQSFFNYTNHYKALSFTVLITAEDRLVIAES